jgi:O-Antigen ligase
MLPVPAPAVGRTSQLTRFAELVTTYGLAAFVLTLPLEFTALWLHQQLSRLVLAVVAIAFVYLLLTGRRTLAFPRTLSVWLLLAYVVLSLVSWTVTRAPGSGSSVVDVALYPIVGLLIANLAVSEDDHRRAWIAMLGSGLGVALIGAVLYLTHTAIWTPNAVVANRLNITFGDPNITARFLTICASAAVLLFAARQAPAWLAMAAAVGCAAVLPLTWSRSGLALFIFGVLIALLVAVERRRATAIAAVALAVFLLSTGINPQTRIRAVGAVETVVAAVTGTAANFSQPATGGENGVALEDNRKYLVAAGLQMFRDHPALGVGFGGYQHALTTRYSSFLPHVSVGQLDTLSHASLVTVMAEQGVVGTLVFLAFLVQFLREALGARMRRDPRLVWSMLAAVPVITIFLYSQFEGRFIQEPYLWLALGLFYSAEMRAMRSTRRDVLRDAGLRAA